MSQPDPKPTDSETQILGILWKRGPSTVREVHELLGREAGYTSVLKLMQIMAEKGLLLRSRRGKTHVYRPSGAEQTMQAKIVGPLLDKVFGGSTQKLLAAALSAKRASPKELAEIKQMIERAEKEEQDPSGRRRTS